MNITQSRLTELPAKERERGDYGRWCGSLTCTVLTLCKRVRGGAICPRVNFHKLDSHRDHFSGMTVIRQVPAGLLASSANKDFEIACIHAVF